MSPERFQKIKNALNKRQPDLTVIMDNVHKPHNLAAIIRSCDAIGIGNIHGISLSNKKVGINLKSASGSNHWVKLNIHHSRLSLFDSIKKQKIKIYAANKSNKSIDFRTVSFLDPCAIVLGAELDGISDSTLDLVDQEINIPMLGMVKSLNVSVANAVILYEIQRQRKKAGFYNKTMLDKNEYKKLLFEFSYPEIAAVYKKKRENYPDLDSQGQIIN